MKRMIYALVLAFSVTASASVPNMNCTVKNYCKFKSVNDLGVCLDKKFSIINDVAIIGAGNDGALTEIFRVVTEIPVQSKISEGYRKVLGMTMNGESWLELLPKNLSNSSRIFEGRLTVEQDFEFSVSCRVK